jgi:hypothetical protein
MKVCVVQTDNRPTLDYLCKTQQVNRKFSNILNYDYLFIPLDTSKHDLHPATQKIHILDTFLQESKHDILVFLDSDAWIQNGYWLNTVVSNLYNSNKQGCFSRDPYRAMNTFINSGSFILKINDYTRNMYKTIIKKLYENTHYHKVWPYDQYYTSNFITENKQDFTIFVPDILNTPIGKVLRHNWGKFPKMYTDLDYLISNNLEHIIDKSSFIETDYYDNKPFPNLAESCYNYCE